MMTMEVEVGPLLNYLGVLFLSYPGTQTCGCRVSSINTSVSES